MQTPLEGEFSTERASFLRVVNLSQEKTAPVLYQNVYTSISTTELKS